jgi:hypothetical protein
MAERLFDKAIIEQKFYLSQAPILVIIDPITDIGISFLL